ncbi:helix-turn-helix domain-containing protein [Kribbella sp. NPDC054772]
MQGRRAADILTMHRLAHKPDGARAIVGWLARRTSCWVGLVDPAGRVRIASARGSDSEVTMLVADGLRVMRERRLRTVVTGESAGRWGVLLSVDVPGDESGVVLALVGVDPLGTSAAADAAPLIGVCWWVSETERTRRRLESADARGREAVLHLLMSGNLTTAHQIADLLAPSLSDPARFHVVECGAERRTEAIRICAEHTGGQAWIVRCPVYSDHVLVVASADPADARSLETALTSELDDCVVGTGDALALRKMASGYEQAFHALAVARGRPERWARFDGTLGLPVMLGPPGHAWADRLLAPLTKHTPARTADPDSHTLTATVRSWLIFSSAASRHLKIHRNTLAARLRRVEALLGLDLESLGDQAKLDLALRIVALPHLADHEPVTAGPALDAEFHALLRLPAVREWALTQWRPVHEEAPAMESTLRAWLRHDTRLSTTASALGVSVTGTRKRLTRLEAVLGRSLLRVPNARHDLWLAGEVLDRGEPEMCRSAP